MALCVFLFSLFVALSYWIFPPASIHRISKRRRKSSTTTPGTGCVIINLLGRFFGNAAGGNRIDFYALVCYSNEA